MASVVAPQQDLASTHYHAAAVEGTGKISEFMSSLHAVSRSEPPESSRKVELLSDACSRVRMFL